MSMMKAFELPEANRRLARTILRYFVKSSMVDDRCDVIRALDTATSRRSPESRPKSSCFCVVNDASGDRSAK